MVSIPRTATHEEFAVAISRPDLRSSEMRLFMCMTEDGIDIDIIDEDEDECTAMTMSIRVPSSFNSGVGRATLRHNWNHGDVCRIIGGDPRSGDITLMESRMRRGHAIVLAFTCDQIHDLMKGSNYIYTHGDEWVEFGDVRGAWVAHRHHAVQSPVPLAA